ncbi:amidase signature domain-containing protein [Morchella snyderi]|nr:amidase signature domain-containing protein [Morchella snyderi]
MATIAPYLQISQQKLKERDAQIPTEYLLTPEQLSQLNSQQNITHLSRSEEFFTPAEITIINSSAPAIVAKTSAGEWSVQEVTEAFIKAAMIAHQATNCLTEIPIPEARALAKALDTTPTAPRGPLYGLPLSLKDNFNVYPSVYSTSVGFTAWSAAQCPAPPESGLVTLLRDLGAIPGFVKTNVPTGMMMLKGVNRLWGETLSPFSKVLSPGGSSTGEGVLVALRGAPVGVGTDIGGSIRIPASWGGLYSLKPSSGRFPMIGARSGLSGQQELNMVSGPIAAELESVRMFCKAVVGAEPWRYDPGCVPIPWREGQMPVGRKLRIGVLRNDGFVRCQPSVERAVDMVRKVLEESGEVEAVDWKPFKHAEVNTLLGRLFTADGARNMAGLINTTQEPWYDSMLPYRAVSTAPDTDLPTSAMWELQRLQSTLQKEHLDHWRASGVDAVITPVAPWAAVRRGASAPMPYGGYTGVWNFHDYVAATLPVTMADRSVDLRDEGYVPVNEIDRAVWEDYEPDVYHGGLAGVQVVCGRLEEEKCLEVVGFVDALLRCQAASDGV